MNSTGRPSLRRNTQFQLLWVGAATSSLGSALTAIAIPLLLLHLTHSPATVGGVAALATVTGLVLTIPAGVWVDRSDRRVILLGSQSVSFVNSAALTLALLLGHANVANFVVFAVISGACTSIFGPAFAVALRNIVHPADLRQAFAQEQARNFAAQLIGPAIGGGLYAVDARLPFVLDTLTYLISLICAVACRVPRRPVTTGPDTSQPPRRHMIHEALDAARWLFRQRGLREMVLIITAMNFLGGAFSIPVIVHIRSMGGSSSLTGIVLAGQGVGGLIGALWAARLITRVPPGRLGILVPTIFGCCMIIAAAPIAVWWPVVPIVVFCMFTPALNVALNATTAELVPIEMLGRLGALLSLTAISLRPAGQLLGGIASGTIGGGATMVCVGVGLLAAAGIAATSKTLRAFNPEPPDTDLGTN